MPGKQLGDYFDKLCQGAILTLLISGCGSGLRLGPDSIGADASGDPGSGSGDGSGSGSGGSTTVINRFPDLVGSQLHRDKTATQVTLTQELNQPKTSLPSGYRQVPDLTKDNDGSAGGTVTFQSRPTIVCGASQSTIAARIADCASLNGAGATWNGATNGNAGQATWKLVTYNGTHEVWRDELTTLIWSDYLGDTNWCRASGNSGGGPYGQADPSNFCDNVGFQNQVTPESWCTEDAGFSTPAMYDTMKGGMRLTATATSPSIAWRLPTKYGFHQAEIDGFRFVVPNAVNSFWSATAAAAPFQTDALFYQADVAGTIMITTRSNVTAVRCVGR